ncbi:MAG: hypothetical protein QOI47_1601 [Actinomycetota bacterium]|jgi:hypothetical protein|nr:hypothetical protein [Actinomycetota bacterium]
MGVRLEPQDEHMHELGPESNFNESMYFNMFDPASKVGGFFRLGNRANEGQAEMTTCLYLPSERGRRVAFMYKRPEISDNDAFDAGGMRFDVVTPFEELKVGYSGKVVLLDDPLQMANPKKAFTENPHADAEVSITYTRVSDMFGGEPDTPHDAPGEEFSTGHYEQLNKAVGSIRVGDDEWEVAGYGLRDHSWGPRFWQAPWYYRWLTANFGGDFGFMGALRARRDGEGSRGGFVWDDGEMHLCDGFSLATGWHGDDKYHQDIEATLVSSRSGKEWKVTGKVLSMIPLRNRRTDPDGNLLVTRISEGMTEWTLSDGRIGYGLSEYLDQIIDDEPVGIAE